MVNERLGTVMLNVEAHAEYEWPASFEVAGAHEPSGLVGVPVDVS